MYAYLWSNLDTVISHPCGGVLCVRCSALRRNSLSLLKRIIVSPAATKVLLMAFLMGVGMMAKAQMPTGPDKFATAAFIEKYLPECPGATVKRRSVSVHWLSDDPKDIGNIYFRDTKTDRLVVIHIEKVLEFLQNPGEQLLIVNCGPEACFHRTGEGAASSGINILTPCKNDGVNKFRERLLDALDHYRGFFPPQKKAAF